MTQYRSRPEVDASSVGDRVVLYHRGTRAALVLNPTGSFLWSRLAQPQTATDLAAALVARFPGLDDGTAQRDAEAFLTELDGHEMLTAEAP